MKFKNYVPLTLPMRFEISASSFKSTRGVALPRKCVLCGRQQLLLLELLASLAERQLR